MEYADEKDDEIVIDFSHNSVAMCGDSRIKYEEHSRTSDLASSALRNKNGGDRGGRNERYDGRVLQGETEEEKNSFERKERKEKEDGEDGKASHPPYSLAVVAVVGASALLQSVYQAVLFSSLNLSLRTACTTLFLAYSLSTVLFALYSVQHLGPGLWGRFRP